MKRTMLGALALAVLLTGCSNSTESAEAANVQMRVQDGYIQYYNGTDWENLIATEELKGEPGEKGDKGDKGDQGEPGTQGERGPAGATGATGAAGVQGAKGDKGDKGDRGLTGAQGDKGEKGDKGDPGASAAKTRQFQILVTKNNALTYQDKDVIEITDSYNATVFTNKTDKGTTNFISFTLGEDGWADVKVKSLSGDTFKGWSDGETKETRRITYKDETILFGNYATTWIATPVPEPTATPEPPAPESTPTPYIEEPAEETTQAPML